MFNNQYLMIDELYLNGMNNQFTPKMQEALDSAVAKMSDHGEALVIGVPVLQKEGRRAMININGPMKLNPNILDKIIHSAVSTQEVNAAVLDVAQDTQIESVVFNINSPGGEANMINNVADRVAQLSSMKATAAVNTGMMCSASYFIGSQAGKVFSSDLLSETGSIGTVGFINDHTKQAEMSGIKVFKIATGVLKGAGHMGTEITPEILKHIQGKIDRRQEDFSNAVSSKRPDADMSDGSEARSGASFFHDDAMRLGLVDGIKTIEQAFEFLEQGNRASQLRQSI